MSDDHQQVVFHEHSTSQRGPVVQHPVAQTVVQTTELTNVHTAPQPVVQQQQHQNVAASGAQYVLPPGASATAVDTNMQKFDMLRQALPAVSIFLQPLAAPSAMGFAAFFCATWTMSTWYCGWYGSIATPPVIAPFILLMGIAEFFAAFFCYPARDTTGTVFHGAWGGWWMAFGVYFILIGQGHLSWSADKYAGNGELAMLLVTITAITGCVFLVVLAKDLLLAGGSGLLFVGGVLFFGGWFGNTHHDNAIKAGGYFWMVASLVFLLRAVIYMMPFDNQEEYGDAVTSKRVRGQPRVAVPIGEPGIRTFH